MRFLLFTILFVPIVVQAQSIKITASADTLCSGNTIKFTATVDGYSYPHFRWKYFKWNTGKDSSVYTTSSLSPGDAISCHLTNSSRDTVIAISNTIYVQVDTFLSYLERKLICVGDTIKSDTFNKCYYRDWRFSSRNSILIVGSRSIAIVAKKEGVDTLIVSYFNNYYQMVGLPDTAIIHINKSPEILGLSGICIGKSLTLTDSLAGGVWKSENNSIATINNNTGWLTGIAPGKTTILYTMPSGCYGTRKIGVEDCSNGIELYPVPARDVLVIHTHEGLYNDCIITNSVGKIMHIKHLKGAYTLINTSFYPSGIYQVHLSGNNTANTMKFVKE